MDQTRRKSEGRVDEDGFSLSQAIVLEFARSECNSWITMNPSMSLYHVCRLNITLYFVLEYIFCLSLIHI